MRLQFQDILLPAGFLLLKPGAKCIVMYQQLLYSRLKQFGIQGGARLKECSLVPILRIQQLLLKKPVLEGCQRHRASNQTLLCPQYRGHTSNRS